MSVFLSIQWKP